MHTTDRLVLVAVSLGMVVASLSAADKGKAADILGTWAIVSGEKDGRKDPDNRHQGTVVRITKDAITVTDKTKKETYAATYRLDTRTAPWNITMTATSGDLKGKVAEGILELDGDRLKLCYALPGVKRPTNFATKQGSRELFFVLMRAK